jgi:Salmonella virulence plasmid 65kDa B protein
MKHFLKLCLILWGVLAQAQTILNQPDTGPKTITDPNLIVLGKGFKGTGSLVYKIDAKALGTAQTVSTTNTAGSQNPSGELGGNLHDTKGNIEVDGGGQLQYTLPIALPPGVKTVAPQVNLVYNSGAGNGIAGYGWNISGLSSINRMGKTIEKDGLVKGIQLDETDFYQFAGQRLLLKSGVYGQDGATYVTEKHSNMLIKSVGAVTGQTYKGPAYWEVTFEDGSMAWYGATTASGTANGRTPMEYNIVKWKDAQGNSIDYSYAQANNVATIANIAWGANENVGTGHFNKIEFVYSTKPKVELAYVNGVKLIQDQLLGEVKVFANNALFKSYAINNQYRNNQRDVVLVSISEKNSAGEAATPMLLS